ncbi:N-6 DNA methylase [Kribbella qitaiheensis]|uniref:N-6 DNA methylase n=1 Tax=Kribbella qitaiheensis TaxID=1544730 RepID=UPI0036080C7F
MDQPGMVSSIGIAKLAGVGRAAVSNWRRRYADFPQPVAGTATSPAFELAAVERWLSSQGKLPAASAPQRIWREIEAASGGPDLASALWLAGMSLFARWVDAEVEGRAGFLSPDRLADVVRRVDPLAADLLAEGMPDAWSPREQAVLAAVERLEADEEPAAVFEQLYQQYLSARGSASDYMTPAGVARLMLQLAGRVSSVMDAACGTGSLVAQAVVAGGGAPVQCFAQDLDATAARIAQVRLLFAHRLAGVGGPPSIVRVGDSLRVDAFPGHLVDAVVSNPPFGLHDWGHDQLAYDQRWAFGGLPPRTEPELAWVQDALAHLEPGGLAVLLMPPAAASRSAGRRIRGELLRRGALRAVIGLPQGLLPATSVGLHLWILRRPAGGEQPSHMLVVDTASAVGGRKLDLTAVTDTAVDAWRAFDRDPAAFGVQAGVCRAVPVIELLDEDIDVSPARHLPVDLGPELDAADLLAARGDLVRRLASLERSIPQFVDGGESSLASARRASLEELTRSGSLVIHRRLLRSGSEDAAANSSAVTGADVVRGAPPTGSAPADAVSIEAGDVLVPSLGRALVARVATDEQVGARLGNNLHAIRADPQVLDPWFLAGVLSAGENAREAARSSSTLREMMRVNVKRLQVPVLPLEDQKRYGEAFRRLAEFEAVLACASDEGRELARGLSDALSSGVLTPESGE